MINLNIILKNLYNFTKRLVFVIFFIFVLNQVFKNLKFFEIKFIENLPLILLIFFIHIIHHNFLNLRLYLLIKNCTNYSGSFFNWAKIFFGSLAFNLMISHTGSAYRAIELKKNNVEYEKFLGLYYISFLGYLIVNLLLINIEILFIDDVTENLKWYIFFIFSIIFCLAIFFPYLSSLLINKFQIYNIKIIKKIFNIGLTILFFIKNSVKKSGTILIIIVFSSTSHLFEFLLFYLSYDLFMTELKIETLIILFSLSFVLDRVPIISNIPGLNETIFAAISVPMGLYFNESFLTKLTLRFTGYFSVILNLLVYRFFYQTNK